MQITWYQSNLYFAPPQWLTRRRNAPQAQGTNVQQHGMEDNKENTDRKPKQFTNAKPTPAYDQKPQKRNRRDQNLRWNPKSLAKAVRRHYNKQRIYR